MLGVDSLTVGTEGTVTFLFSFSFAVGPGVLAVGAAPGLCYAFARSYLRRRRPADDPSDAADGAASDRS